MASASCVEVGINVKSVAHNLGLNDWHIREFLSEYIDVPFQELKYFFPFVGAK